MGHEAVARSYMIRQGVVRSHAGQTGSGNHTRSDREWRGYKRTESVARSYQSQSHSECRGYMWVTGQTGSGEVTQGHLVSREVTKSYTGSSEVTCGSDREWQGHRKSDRVVRSHNVRFERDNFTLKKTKGSSLVS